MLVQVKVACPSNGCLSKVRLLAGPAAPGPTTPSPTVPGPTAPGPTVHDSAPAAATPSVLAPPVVSSLLQLSFAVAIPASAALGLVSTAVAVPASVPLAAQAPPPEKSHLRSMTAAYVSSSVGAGQLRRVLSLLRRGSLYCLQPVQNWLSDCIIRGSQR